MSGPLNVLLIEDNPGDARLIAAMLEEAAGTGRRFALHCAKNLAAGAQRLREGGIDLVLLDLGLPESTGLQTLERLFAEVPQVPTLIVLSGLSDEDVAVQALQCGAQDYLIKGQVDGDLLRRSIRYAIGRHQAEGESQGLRRLLDERDQMLAEREEMLRVLAHEVRQPLNNASAALEGASAAIAASGEQLLPRVRKPLERAQQVLDHVIGTLNNALAAATMLSSGAGDTAADTDLDTLIGLVVRDIGLEQRARVKVESSSEVRTVQLQPMMMRLALCNLLVNALAYSPPGSPVTLRISDSEDPPALRFEVCDEGEGIPVDLLPRVFDKGTRGANARAGTGAGLGLYIVRQVVGLHHGSVELLPNAPHGTIVRVTLPQDVGA
jgi:signal transduction histidine kinase